MIQLRRHRWLRLVPLLIFVLLLCGCMFAAPDTLYALPEQPAAYEKLQLALNDFITDDMNFSAPLSGDNRQPVQMQDLNGDGKNEAIVFARGQSDLPLKILIFIRDSDDAFTLTSTIEGEGTAFESVSYAEVDGSPGLDIIVGFRLNETVPKSLGVYSLDGPLTMKLMSSGYTSYTVSDMDADGRSDLFLLRRDSETGANLAELFCFRDGSMTKVSSEALATGAPEKLSSGKLSPDFPAVFVTMKEEDTSSRTDVYAIRDGELSIAVSERFPAGGFATYAADMNGDGLTELPHLISGTDGTSSRILEWYRLSADGKKTTVLLTYHDYENGFYLTLDTKWKNRFTVVKDSTIYHGSGFRFTEKYGNTDGSFLIAVYVFNGSDRAHLAEASGRFLLGELNDVCISAEIGKGKLAENLTKEALTSAFHPIVTE